jgi:hypothetical protein
MVNNVFRKLRILLGNVEKHDTARLAKDDDTALRIRFACWVVLIYGQTHNMQYLLPPQRLHERTSLLRYT